MRDYTEETPVSDEVFEVYRNLYSYDPSSLDARTESFDESDLWRREVVSFDASYGDERVTAHLFFPKDAEPPFQTVLYFPGAYAVNRDSISITTPPDGLLLDWILKSRRALVYPVYNGTFERQIGRSSWWPETTRAYREWVIQMTNDAQRTVDYLETRPDVFQLDKLAYYGWSWGGYLGPLILAVEERLAAGILLDGGLAQAQTSPEVDPFNFASRVSVPILMINGDQDFIFPVDTSQRPLFDLLGSPGADKNWIRHPSGHGVLFVRQNQITQQRLDFLDKHLGSVN